MRQFDKLEKRFADIETNAHEAVTSSPLFELCENLIDLINDGEAILEGDDARTAKEWYRVIKSLNPTYLQVADDCLYQELGGTL